METKQICTNFLCENHAVLGGIIAALVAACTALYGAINKKLYIKYTGSLVFISATCLGLLVYDKAGELINSFYGIFLALASLAFPFALVGFNDINEWLSKDRYDDPDNYYKIYLSRSTRLDKEARLILLAIFILIIGASIVFSRQMCFPEMILINYMAAVT